MSLYGRLAKLEAVSGASARQLFVIERLERETNAEAISAASVHPADSDTVILVTRFAPSDFSDDRQRQVSVQELRA